MDEANVEEQQRKHDHTQPLKITLREVWPGLKQSCLRGREGADFTFLLDGLWIHSLQGGSAVCQRGPCVATEDERGSSHRELQAAGQSNPGPTLGQRHPKTVTAILTPKSTTVSQGTSRGLHWGS